MYFAVMRSGSITRRLDYDYDYITEENIRDYVVYVANLIISIQEP